MIFYIKRHYSRARMLGVGYVPWGDGFREFSLCLWTFEIVLRWTRRIK